MKIIMIFFFLEKHLTLTREKIKRKGELNPNLFSLSILLHVYSSSALFGFFSFFSFDIYTFIYSLFLCAIRDDIIRYYSLKLTRNMHVLAVCVSTSWDTNIRES